MIPRHVLFGSKMSVHISPLYWVVTMVIIQVCLWERGAVTNLVFPFSFGLLGGGVACLLLISSIDGEPSILSCPLTAALLERESNRVGWGRRGREGEGGGRRGRRGRGEGGEGGGGRGRGEGGEGGGGRGKEGEGGGGRGREGEGGGGRERRKKEGKEGEGGGGRGRGGRPSCSSKTNKTDTILSFQ